MLVQIIDNEIYGLDLVRRERPAREKVGEGLLGGVTFKADEGTYEQA
jgi:hypothetical protein